MKPSLTVIIPAFNEEGDLENAVQSVLGAISDILGSYEVLIVDDGSTDSTGKIADRLAALNPNIKVAHNGRNRGVGYTLQRGIELATKDYVTIFPGDNGMERKSLRDMSELIGKADLVIPYIVNSGYRTPFRQFLSQGFTVIMNSLFGLNLKYYNGSTIFKSDLIKALPISNSSYAFLAEALVRLIKAGSAYVETPMYCRQRQHGESKAFRLKNVRDVVMTLLRLFWDIRVKRTWQNAPRRNFETLSR